MRETRSTHEARYAESDAAVLNGYPRSISPVESAPGTATHGLARRGHEETAVNAEHSRLLRARHWAWSRPLAQPARPHAAAKGPQPVVPAPQRGCAIGACSPARSS